MSNRGEISKFTIEKSVAGNKLPKAHTCFNRLELPNFATMQEMQEGLSLCLNENIIGVFGMA